jgi:hypothetical protein
LGGRKFVIKNDGVDFALFTDFRKLQGAHTVTVPANEPAVETARRLIEQLT